MAAVRLHQMEYFLHGSINKKNVENLLCRLKGLCDNTSHERDKFSDHEIVYSLRNNPHLVTLRARHSLVDTAAPWLLRYVGQAEMGDKSRATLLRSCVEVETSDNLSAFLEELGFKFDYEFVLSGYYFYKGHIKITVSQVFRLPVVGDMSSMQLASESYLVEIGLTTAVQQDSVAEDIKAFAEHLKPLVHLEKVDHRKLLLMS
ncbi:mediator of RNA polymerase II transcription subunit 18-like [Actinia tenebrosa]|uniref:Mediator of RNA polymerase II transcription subunit 18 n=1 Tax=Actinia tenebrosa TaxID=6105 RepID=A0A6P8ILM5_ACTTE|nr:mediator of RNA polymerase II transcription subunit 18-like [Actinia tenebrosa]